MLLAHSFYAIWNAIEDHSMILIIAWFLGIEKGKWAAVRGSFTLFPTLLCIVVVLLTAVPRSNAPDSTVCLSITPTMYVAQRNGELFNVTINVAGVCNLRSYQFTLAYNNSLLRVAKVFPGSFFPPPPGSQFEFDDETSGGLSKVNCSLTNSVNSLSGGGSLASITFKVISGPDLCVSSPLELKQTLLLDSNLTPISHDFVDAVYFWKSIEPDQPSMGLLLDFYTQRGGVGPNQPGGYFKPGEEVDLISLVTYSGYPVQSKLVAFQLVNPANQTLITRTAVTDQNGLATLSFIVPNSLNSLGVWVAISNVEVAKETAWDILTFQVTPAIPVGGFSISMKGSPTTIPLTPYYVTVLTAILTLVAIKRKPKRV
jgi:hypothetical protein